MKLLISQRAEEDLALIYALIERDRPDVAEAFRAATQGSFDLLASHPQIGPPVRFRTRHTGLRFWPVPDFRNYLIYYFAEADQVSVERVLDGRRDVARIFRSGEF